MNVDDVIAEKIAAAKARAEAAKQRRARIEAARAAGLHYRHRAKLARLDQAEQPSVRPNERLSVPANEEPTTEGTTS